MTYTKRVILFSIASHTPVPLLCIYLQTTLSIWSETKAFPVKYETC